MGKFAWFILGLVLGVALALVAVTMMDRGRPAGAPESQPSADVRPLPVEPLTPRPALAPVPPKIKKIDPAAAPPPPAHADRAAEEAQVAEDAAAAGMTSRARPAQAASDQPGGDTH